LYFIKPLLFVVLVLFWVSTGVISLCPGWDHGMELMREGGVGERMAALSVIAGALSDIVIGLAIAYRPTSRLRLDCGASDFDRIRNHRHNPGS
jgi:hypothetical protein